MRETLVHRVPPDITTEHPCEPKTLPRSLRMPTVQRVMFPGR